MRKGKNEQGRPNARLPRGVRMAVLLVCILLAAATAVGGTLAYFFNTSGGVENTFTAGQVGSRVVESFDGTQKTAIAVMNDGGTVPVYVRARLVTYWVDENGNVAAKNSAVLSPSIDSDKWIDGGNLTYYYKTPLQGGGATDNLLTAPLVLTEEDGCRQVVEVLAEVIQANPADAAEEAWGVRVAANGSISK